MAPEKPPPTDLRPPCELCGSTEHTRHHDGSEPPGHHDAGPPGYATEVIHVDDDDRGES